MTAMDQDTCFLCNITARDESEVSHLCHDRRFLTTSVVRILDDEFLVLGWGTCLDMESWFLEANTQLQSYKQFQPEEDSTNEQN